LKSNKEKAETRIKEAFHKLREQLDQREKELLEASDSIYQKKQTTLSSQKDQLQKVLSDMTYSSHYAQKLLELGTKVEIAMTCNPVDERLRSLSASSYPLHPLATPTLLFFNEKFPELVEKLRHCGSVEPEEASTPVTKSKASKRGTETPDSELSHPPSKQQKVRSTDDSPSSRANEETRRGRSANERESSTVASFTFSFLYFMMEMVMVMMIAWHRWDEAHVYFPFSAPPSPLFPSPPLPHFPSL